MVQLTEMTETTHNVREEFAAGTFAARVAAELVVVRAVLNDVEAPAAAALMLFRMPTVPVQQIALLVYSKP